jgi:tripartite-type tricarboxylate transporter receptor subunit TctC
VQLTISDVGLVTPHIKAGRLRALAITSPEPSPLAPGMPTVAASGYPGYEWSGYSGTWVPAKTPAPIINRLNQELVRFLTRPETRERFLSMGLDAVGNAPDEFATIIRNDLAKTGKVIKDAGLKAD